MVGIAISRSASTATTWILDVGVVCPGTQRYVDQGSGTTTLTTLTPKHFASTERAHRDWRRRPTPRSKRRSTPTKTTSSRYPRALILETGGRVNKAAHDWLDALTAPAPCEQVPSQDDHPWNPQARTTTETVLREAMQALVRVQAHMLARIMVEVRAAGIAVELEP
jgi:hypothetical protein